MRNCNTMKLLVMASVILLTALVSASPPFINYQAVLKDGAGSPVSGSYLIHFSIWNVESGGTVNPNQLWTESQTVTSNVNGSFHVQLGKFNPLDGGIFSESDRWLQIQVDGDIPMAPRTPIGSVPYSLLAGDVPNGTITRDKLLDDAVGPNKIEGGAVGNDKLALGAVGPDKIEGGAVGNDKLAGNSVSSDKIQGGAVGQDKLATGAVGPDKIEGGAVGNDKLAGNSVSSDKIQGGAVGNDKLATGAVGPDKIQNNAVGHDKLETDAVGPTKIQNNAVGHDKLETDAVGPTKIQNNAVGHDKLEANAVGPTKIQGNAVTSDKILDGTIELVDIGGNGAADGQIMKWNNSSSLWVIGNDLTSSGWVDDGATVRLETQSDNVGIGFTSPTEKLEVDGNIRASGDIACVNSIIVGKATIGSGHVNTGLYSFAAGSSNQSTGQFSTVTGGLNNQAVGQYSVVAGGGGTSPAVNMNRAGDWCFVGGGSGNMTNIGPEGSMYSTICGGKENLANASYSFMGGGLQNYTYGDYASLSGGKQNYVHGSLGVVGGGQGNICLSMFGTIGGGLLNSCGDISDPSRDTYSTVGGGLSNIAQGDNAAIPGGAYNNAMGHYSFAAGTMAKANHGGSLVLSAVEVSAPGFISLADSIMSGGIGQMVLRADGHFYLTDKSETAPFNFTRFLNTSTGGYLSNSGIWINASDRNLKENFAPVDGSDILEKLEDLPVTRWNYKSDGSETTHIGPVAQDFYALFGVGDDDVSISSLDPSGVALAAIQQLHITQQELLEKSDEIDNLKSEMVQIRALLEKVLDSKSSGSTKSASSGSR